MTKKNAEMSTPAGVVKPALQPKAPRKELTPAARRALAEAEARRAAAEVPERPKEIGGPKGPEPVRYGDWEVKGRASDF